MTSNNTTRLSNLTHPFFNLTVHQQRAFVGKVVALAILLNLILGVLCVLLGGWPLIPLFISVTLSVIAPVIDVPVLVKKQRLRYYSCFLLGETTSSSPQVQLHGGTLLDYLFCLEQGRADSRKRQVINAMLTGLIKLIEQHNDESDDIKITLTSYILSARTAQRLGFHQQPTDRLQQVILWFNYVNLMLCYSIMNNRLSLPPMRTIHTYQTTLGELRVQRRHLNSLAKRAAKSPSRSSSG